MEIKQLEPTALWSSFAELNAVPRASKKEEQVIQFMLDFADGLGLEAQKDAVGNVLVRKPATAGMEQKAVVILQSHLDMVHQKNNDVDFDFDSQGIQMYVDGDWVRAKGTTLGADNGIGVAAIMALLESKDIPHPALEALFTIDEETGMTGAKGLQPGFLKGDILLNLDTEEDTEIDIGCAGGIDVTARKSYAAETLASPHVVYELAVKGLQGGHSGMDIHKGFGNANKLMNRVLSELQPLGLRIASIDGGSLRNAIPRESVAVVAFETADQAAVEAKVAEMFNIINKELASVEPNLAISIAVQDEKVLQVLPLDVQDKLIKSLYAAPNAVYRMSADFADLVETSNNIARVEVRDEKIVVKCLTRSSVETAKYDLANALKASFELMDAEVSFSGDYPGWTPDPNSSILAVLESTYKSMFSDEPAVVACHAGLECGLLGSHYPEMEMISFGPTILGAHSPDERVSIPSVQKFWGFLQQILLNTPDKK